MKNKSQRIPVYIAAFALCARAVAPIGRQPMELLKRERSSSGPGLRLKRAHPKSTRKKKCQNPKCLLQPARRRLENLKRSDVTGNWETRGRETAAGFVSELTPK